MLVLLVVGGVLVLAACGGGGTEATAEDTIDLNTLGSDIDVETAHALHGNPNVFMLDVREPDEYAAGHIPGITLIPMGEIIDRLNEIPTDQEVIVTCRTGNRSAQIADYLNANGEHGEVANLEGGIIQWAAEGLPYEGAPPS